jgi:hypothetical protein
MRLKRPPTLLAALLLHPTEAVVLGVQEKDDDQKMAVIPNNRRVDDFLEEPSLADKRVQSPIQQSQNQNQNQMITAEKAKYENNKTVEESSETPDHADSGRLEEALPLSSKTSRQLVRKKTRRKTKRGVESVEKYPPSHVLQSFRGLRGSFAQGRGLMNRFGFPDTVQGAPLAPEDAPIATEQALQSPQNVLGNAPCTKNALFCGPLSAFDTLSYTDVNIAESPGSIVEPRAIVDRAPSHSPSKRPTRAPTPNPTPSPSASPSSAVNEPVCFTGTSEQVTVACAERGYNCCTGVSACVFLVASVCENSCNGEEACFFPPPVTFTTISTESCNGFAACKQITADIGLRSCNGNYACADNSGTIGNDSCNGVGQGLGSDCYKNTGTIGDNSCNGEGTTGSKIYELSYACMYNSGDIGDESCQGFSTCNRNSNEIGTSSCNNFRACEYNNVDRGNGECNMEESCLVNFGTAWMNAP